MPLTVADRVFETSTTAGVGTYTLDGAQPGFQAFSVIGANNQCTYFATDDTFWEVGIGTYLTAPNRLTRDTILASSNAGAAVNWGGSTIKLRVSMPAAGRVPKIEVNDGSAAAPSVKVGDEQNGLFSPSANTLGIATAGQEAVRIDSLQMVGVNVTPTHRLQVEENALSRRALFIKQSDAAGGAALIYHASDAAASNILELNCDAAASTAFNFARLRSDENGTPDTEFVFRGDGTALADGSFTGSGADYQEYLESVDGTALPVGTTVVLVGDKVRSATPLESLEHIIGVVRPKEDNKNSAVIGNAAWNHWTDKYLTDEYGRYITEEYKVYEWTEIVPPKREIRPVQKTVKKTVTQQDVQIANGVAVMTPRVGEIDEPALTEYPLYNADGSPCIKDGKQMLHREPVMEERAFVVEPEKRIPRSHADYKMPEGVVPPHDATVKVLKRRTPNPLWDKERAYTPRHDRPEWNLIGMLGQVQILKGQPVHPSWRKMKDVSATVELWFIR